MSCGDQTEPDIMQRVLDETMKQGERLDRMEEVLRAIRFDLNGVIDIVRDFGLRLRMVERRSETPPPSMIPTNGG